MELKEGGVYILPDFLTAEECTKYRALVLNPPTAATNFTDTGIFTNRKWTDFEITAKFFSKIQEYIVPTSLALRANKLVMTGHYRVGEQFNIHTDTGLYYDKPGREKSRWTLLIYLNDDFEGGQTVFYDDKWNETIRVKPEAGKAILFDIDLWHKGDLLQSGTKIWIGCEVIGTI